MDCLLWEGPYAGGKGSVRRKEQKRWSIMSWQQLSFHIPLSCLGGKEVRRASREVEYGWFPCLYLDPRCLSCFLPVLLKKREGGSSTVGAWQPAKVNTPFLSYLWALIASLDCELEGLWNPVYLEGTAGTLMTSWNLVLVINAHRQSFDWTDAAWSHSVWQRHKTINFNHP